MIQKWIDDIRTKTEHMSREEKTEYILAYYWYHILLSLLALGLCVLLIYHIGWGKREKDFSLILVNQEVDFARDKMIRDEFSTASGLSQKRVLVDSDYLLSYEGVELEGVNESSYEKFFFNWSAGEVDAMILPESFYHYCKSQDGTFADLSEFLTEEEMKCLSGRLFEDEGTYTGLFVSQTKLAGYLAEENEDSVMLVFPKEMTHKMSCQSFLDYVLSEEKTLQAKEEP